MKNNLFRYLKNNMNFFNEIFFKFAVFFYIFNLNLRKQDFNIESGHRF